MLTLYCFCTETIRVQHCIYISFEWENLNHLKSSPFSRFIIRRKSPAGVSCTVVVKGCVGLEIQLATSEIAKVFLCLWRSAMITECYNVEYEWEMLRSVQGVKFCSAFPHSVHKQKDLAPKLILTLNMGPDESLDEPLWCLNPFILSGHIKCS